MFPKDVFHTHTRKAWGRMALCHGHIKWHLITQCIVEGKPDPSAKWALGPVSAVCRWLFYTSCILLPHIINVCVHFRTYAGNSEKWKEKGELSVRWLTVRVFASLSRDQNPLACSLTLSISDLYVCVFFNVSTISKYLSHYQLPHSPWQTGVYHISLPLSRWNFETGAGPTVT